MKETQLDRIENQRPSTVSIQNTETAQNMQWSTVMPADKWNQFYRCPGQIDIAEKIWNLDIKWID